MADFSPANLAQVKWLVCPILEEFMSLTAGRLVHTQASEVSHAPAWLRPSRTYLMNAWLSTSTVKLATTVIVLHATLCHDNRFKLLLRPRGSLSPTLPPCLGTHSVSPHQ